MIEEFKRLFSEGDLIKIYLVSGKEVRGTISAITDSSITIKTDDGTPTFFPNIIGGWEGLDVKVPKDKIKSAKEADVDVSEEDSKKQNPKPTSKEIPKPVQNKINRNKQIQKEKKKEEWNFRFNSLDQLKQLREKIIIDESQMTLPANGILKKYFIERKFGFIKDKMGGDHFFHFTEIMDPDLLEKITQYGAEGTQVLCIFSIKGQKMVAEFIFLPKTTSYFIEKSQECFKKSNFKYALNYVNLILENIEDYIPAIDLKNKINFVLKKKRKTSLKSDSLFKEARDQIKKGNSSEAKVMLNQIIEGKGSKSETALKEMAYLLQREGNVGSAINIVVENLNLIKSTDPYSFLAYFYEVDNNYEEVVKCLLNVKTASHNEKLKLHKRLAIAQFRLEKYDEAIDNMYPSCEVHLFGMKSFC